MMIWPSEPCVCTLQPLASMSQHVRPSASGGEPPLHVVTPEIWLDVHEFGKDGTAAAQSSSSINCRSTAASVPESDKPLPAKFHRAAAN